MDNGIQIAAVEAVTESSSDEPALPRPARRKRTRRFKKLSEAAQNGDAKPPVDLRYLQRAGFGADSTKECVSEVLSFLESIYCSVAENLPDVRDATWDEGPPEDPYGMSTGLEPAKVPIVEKQVKVKKHQRAVKVCPGRSVADGMEERFLPAGTMKEYWIQYKNQSQSEQQAAFPTFWRVPCNELM
eukprot:s1635_g21.t1